MTDPRTPDAANSLRTARLWLALLLALLVAALPGPQPAATPDGQVRHLHAPADALTAIHGRNLVAREDIAQVRPLAAATLPPPAASLPPPRNPARVLYRHHARRGAGTCPITPRARDPPILRLTA